MKDSNMMASYCQRWNKRLSEPIEPITEQEARRRFEEGPGWFTAVIGDPATPSCTIELNTHATAAKSFFYYSDRSVKYIYEFRRADEERLFLHTLIHYEYPDEPGWHGQSDASVVESTDYTPEGICRITLDDKSKPTLQIEDYRDVDVSPNWEPSPTFGDWASLARLERD